MMTKEQKLEWRSERNQNIKLHALQNHCLHLPPVDCAELMTKLTTDEKLQLLRMLPAKQVRMNRSSYYQNLQTWKPKTLFRRWPLTMPRIC